MLLKEKNPVACAFTMIELLIALVIVGMLLAALTVALNASIVNYNENEAIYRGINEARQALTRMTTQIRTGMVDPNGIADEHTCTVLCSDGNTVRYHYDSVNKRLYLYDFSAGSDYLLCDNVAAIAFVKDNDTESGDVKSVRISITVSDGRMNQTLAAAAVVRKVLD